MNNIIKRIEEIIKNENNDSKYSYDLIYQILYDCKIPELIMKYLSYAGYTGNIINLLDLIGDEDKIKYFTLCDPLYYYYVINSFKDNNNKIKYLDYLDEPEKSDIGICSLTNDEDKIKCIEKIEHDMYKTRVICSLNDDYLKIKYMDNLSVYLKEKIIEGITSDYVLKELYSKTLLMELRVYILMSMRDDKFKANCLNNYSICTRIKILKTFYDVELLVSIISNETYLPYINEFLDIVCDSTFVLLVFNKCYKLIDKLKIIRAVEDKNLKLSLISMLNDETCKTLLMSNVTDKKNKLVSSTDIKDIKLDIDKNITFGVELETCTLEGRELLVIEKLLEDWRIEYEGSVESGVEIISPVLRFDDKSLRELKYICNFMKKNDFYTDKKCGGHIHLGYDYFKSFDEFKIFLNLYGNTEEIIYLICNKAGTSFRPEINRYAPRLRPILDKMSKSIINYATIDECVDEIIKLVKDTRYGLNLSNYGKCKKNTIEFRMPNGEIEFDELILNIRLFVKLMEKSKLIDNLIKNKQSNYLVSLYYRLIDNELKVEEKVRCLLDILFDTDEEKELYYQRFTKNYGINKDKVSGNRKVLRLK